jgi:hypothetical protein
LRLIILSSIAISLAVRAAVAAIDSLALHGAMLDEDAMPAGCAQPRFRP